VTGKFTRLLGVLATTAVLLPACSATATDQVTLRVLASSELADLAPVLADLRAETGVYLQLELDGRVEAAEAPISGGHRHDLAWLSSDRYLQLQLTASGRTEARPISTPMMLSPVVVGMKRASAELLRARGPVSWADIADSAAAGELRFAMADPHAAGSGLAALVGMATAAAGTGRALRPEDVVCDRLRGLFEGQRLSAESSAGLVDRFVANQAELDALVTHESMLLSLNDSGRLAEPLEIIYPTDGIIQSDYPLLLLDPARRLDYDRAVAWLRSEPAQRRIMELTGRRPINPDVPRSPRLQAATGNALYFPDRLEVVEALLSDYDAVGTRPAGQIILVLDFSGSMRGPRIGALRSTLADLTGAGEASFGRFRERERVTAVRFGGSVLAEREFAPGTAGDLAELREFVGSDSFDASTAIWTAADHAYELAAAITAAEPTRPVSIVLMTDGARNAGLTADEFLARYRGRALSSVPMFAIRIGDADAAELARVATATGGRVVDAGADDLPAVVKELRGCL
jgi:Ca-activated chloride channel homolog